jgi:release factor glutamine methyltransferase
MIVSNPPYITESEREWMDRTVTAYEPGEALFVPDSNPLLFYERIATLAGEMLRESGRLFFEIHRSRGKEVCEMLRGKGFREVELRKDLSGNDRMVRAVM